MKPNKLTFLTTVLGIFLAAGLNQNVFADMMPMANQGSMSDQTTDTDQMAADHEEMKKDHEMMMKGHKGSAQKNANNMGKKPAPAQNSGGGMMNHGMMKNGQMGSGNSSQGTSNSMGGGMSDM